ncbi:MAG: outer membrane lipoprotein-sorting protein [Candidatus Omnitrophica bacterium]|nr:outer membrane lipoprotein-sorting protein [Candidatus Omnitrophota bacterium]
MKKLDSLIYCFFAAGLLITGLIFSHCGRQPQPEIWQEQKKEAVSKEVKEPNTIRPPGIPPQVTFQPVVTEGQTMTTAEPQMPRQGIPPAIPPQFPEPQGLLEKMDYILRGTSHDMKVTLDVKTKRWERHYQLRVLMKGVDYAFARVLSPAKVEGQGFLRIKARLWNYLPTAERTILIPPSMMLDRFLGSDFSNDDFVKLSYLPRDYDGKVMSEEMMDGWDVYHLELTPRADAPVSYGKLEIWLRKADAAPVEWKFYDEGFKHIRTIHYSGFRSFGAHGIPTVWAMKNIQEPDRETVVTILDAAFDMDLADSIFTRENLEKYP